MLGLRSILVCSQKTKGRNGTSLVLQWTRVCLPMRGHGLHLWSGKSLSHEGTGALVQQLLQAVPSGAHSLRLRKPRRGRWSLGAQSPHSQRAACAPQLERAPTAAASASLGTAGKTRGGKSKTLFLKKEKGTSPQPMTAGTVPHGPRVLGSDRPRVGVHGSGCVHTAPK